MGSVWRAEHLVLSLPVAIKIIDPQVADRGSGVTRFLREARALAALRSPHIVQVTDFGSQGEVVYLVMELLEGRTLGQRLKAEGRLSPAETLRILRDVCNAMRHAHERGIVHRDLKPDNLFLCDQSREHVTKVIDFGIARPQVLDAGSNTDTGSGGFLGTPSYMSPEQCRGLQTVDQRSDLWALGAIAYECLRGQRLFVGDPVGDVVVRICTGELPLPADTSALPSGFVDWLRKAMAPDPARRFQSASELGAALTVVLERAQEPSPGVDSADTLTAMPTPEPLGRASSTLSQASLAQVSPPPSVPGSSGRSRSPIAIAAGSLGILALFAGVALLGSRAARPGSAAPPALPAQNLTLAVQTADAPVPARGDAGAAGARIERDTQPTSARDESPLPAAASGAAPSPARNGPTRRGPPLEPAKPSRDRAPEADLLRRQR
jgi:eukaryotic-like serine/threonine-protein kinase